MPCVLTTQTDENAVLPFHLRVQSLHKPDQPNSQKGEGQSDLLPSQSNQRTWGGTHEENQPGALLAV